MLVVFAEALLVLRMVSSFGDVLPSQSLGMVLKKLNQITHISTSNVYISWLIMVQFITLRVHLLTCTLQWLKCHGKIFQVQSLGQSSGGVYPYFHRYLNFLKHRVWYVKGSLHVKRRRFDRIPTCGRSSRVVNTSDCGVRGPKFESHHRRLCLSQQPLHGLCTFTVVPRETQEYSSEYASVSTSNSRVRGMQAHSGGPRLPITKHDYKLSSFLAFVNSTTELSKN